MRLSPAARFAKGSLTTYLLPRLAKDTAIDLDPILAELTSKNQASRRGIIAAAVQAQYRSKLAHDADLDDIGEILEALAPILEKEDEGEDGGESEEMPSEGIAVRGDTEANSGVPMAGHPFHEFLKEKLGPEDCERAMDMLRSHADDEEETEEERREREEAEDRAWDMSRDRRADDARRRMGKDESEEEREKREEEEQGAKDARRADDRRRAEDRRMARDKMAKDRSKRRADDARRKLGRDESEAERKAREEREGAADRKHADDRRKSWPFRSKPTFPRGKDSMADDAERWAKDVHQKHAEDRMKAEDKRGMDKRAMDAAIQSAISANDAKHRAISEARETVRPWVGSLSPALAFDSANGVFKKALEMLKIPTEGKHPDAYLDILRAQAQPGQQRPGSHLAHDAAIPAGVRPINERIAGLGRISVMG